MLTAYYNLITKTEKFEKDLFTLSEDLKGKKIILFGLGDSFKDLDKRYDFHKLFDVVAITDGSLKTEKDKEKVKEIKGYNVILPSEIKKQQYNYIVISNEYTRPIRNYISAQLEIKSKVKQIFNEEIADERININHASLFNFEKTLPKLIKKMKNKKVVFYGASSFFETLNHYYDLSGFNVLALSDPRFNKFDTDKTYLGYKTCAPEEIKDLKPDYVIACNRFYIGDVEYLYYDLLKGTKIKVKPLVRKGLTFLVKEILGMQY